MRYALLQAFLLSCSILPARPPVAEFLVTAANSTYWVKSGPTGVRVRSSPLILSRADGHFYELYVGELDRTFADAAFSGERVFRRDLATGDSVVISEDSAVLQRASAYHRRHPRAPLLSPDEDADRDVSYSVSGETDIVNVLGPYIALERRLTVEGKDLLADDTIRTVIDIRNGRMVALGAVAQDNASREAAGTAERAGRRWRNRGYDVIARFDSSGHSHALALQDSRGREWRLGYLRSRLVQIFWLDKPPLGQRTRSALTRAFNEATSYGESVQLVSHRKHTRVRAPIARSLL